MVHREQSPTGPIEVVDTGITRALHFGTPARQSCMWLDAPQRLQLPYTRAMTGILWLLPQPPRKVLLLGLGGGSLAKFFLRYVPGCAIDAVEYNADVVRVAQRYFALPRAARLQIHVGDAAEYVQTAATCAATYDAILVDIFTAAGAPDFIAQPVFIDACRTLLRSQGALALNLWRGRHTGYRQSLRALRHSFGRQPLQLSVEGRGNRIALASKDPHAELRLRTGTRDTCGFTDALAAEFAHLRRSLLRQSGWLHWRRLHPMLTP